MAVVAEDHLTFTGRTATGGRKNTQARSLGIGASKMKLIQQKQHTLVATLLLIPTLSLSATSNPETQATQQQSIGGEMSSNASQSELEQIDVLTPESTPDANQAEMEEIKASDKPDFFKDSSLILRSIWYNRHRTAVNTSPNNAGSAGKIDVSALGTALDFSSGYAWGIIGMDLSLNSNLKIGSSTGQSEVLYYDYVTGQEKSEVAIGRASLKLKLGDETNGFKANVGYTPIEVGTLGTSGGLHSHAYRGFDAKYTFHNFELGYGWADQFHNEWTRSFLDITNSPFQNEAPYQGTGQRIDYIHSLGGRYTFGANKQGVIDVGFGEGKDYRTNQQIAVDYNFDLGVERSLNLIGYYFQGKYDTQLSDIPNPVNEWHTSFGAKYKDGPWSVFAGYGKTYAPNSGELDFSLAPWANADNRNFIQTWGQLDDYVWDGEQVIKLAAEYEVGKLINVPGLVAGVGYNYGWGLVNKDSDGNVIGTSKLSEIDTKLVYTVEKGKLKGLGAGIYAGWLRGDKDFYGKPNRNDVKFIVSYEVALF